MARLRGVFAEVFGRDLVRTLEPVRVACVSARGLVPMVDGPSLRDMDYVDAVFRGAGDGHVGGARSEQSVVVSDTAWDLVASETDNFGLYVDQEVDYTNDLIVGLAQDGLVLPKFSTQVQLVATTLGGLKRRFVDLVEYAQSVVKTGFTKVVDVAGGGRGCNFTVAAYDEAVRESRQAYQGNEVSLRDYVVRLKAHRGDLQAQIDDANRLADEARATRDNMPSTQSIPLVGVQLPVNQDEIARLSQAISGHITTAMKLQQDVEQVNQAIRVIEIAIPVFEDDFRKTISDLDAAVERMRDADNQFALALDSVIDELEVVARQIEELQQSFNPRGGILNLEVFTGLKAYLPTDKQNLIARLKQNVITANEEHAQHMLEEFSGLGRDTKIGVFTHWLTIGHEQLSLADRKFINVLLADPNFDLQVFVTAAQVAATSPMGHWPHATVPEMFKRPGSEMATNQNTIPFLQWINDSSFGAILSVANKPEKWHNPAIQRQLHIVHITNFLISNGNYTARQRIDLSGLSARLPYITIVDSNQTLPVGCIRDLFRPSGSSDFANRWKQDDLADRREQVNQMRADNARSNWVRLIGWASDFARPVAEHGAGNLPVVGPKTGTASLALYGVGGLFRSLQRHPTEQIDAAEEDVRLRAIVTKLSEAGVGVLWTDTQAGFSVTGFNFDTTFWQERMQRAATSDGFSGYTQQDLLGLAKRAVIDPGTHIDRWELFMEQTCHTYQGGGG